MSCERLGQWGNRTLIVLIVLLPKATGGHRPIGLLPFEVRLWGRARTCVTQAWEAQNAIPSLYGGKGMGA